MSASATSRDPACGNRPVSADTNAGFAATLIRSVRSADARRFAPHASSPEATMAMDAVAAASAHAATSAADAADATASTHAASSPSYPSRSTLPAGQNQRDRSNSADATAREGVSPGTTYALDSVARFEGYRRRLVGGRGSMRVTPRCATRRARWRGTRSPW